MSSKSTDQRLYNHVRDLNPLEEVEIRVVERFSEPPVESFIGVITSIDISVFAEKDSIRIEGRTEDLPDPYDWFSVDIWYDVTDEELVTRNVNGFFYNDSNDRVRLPIGKLDGASRRQWREREDVFDLDRQQKTNQPGADHSD